MAGNWMPVVAADVSCQYPPGSARPCTTPGGGVTSGSASLQRPALAKVRVAWGWQNPVRKPFVAPGERGAATTPGCISWRGLGRACRLVMVP